MIPGLDPGLGVLIFSICLSAGACTWFIWSDRRFIRKYGPDPSDAPSPPPASRREG